MNFCDTFLFVLIKPGSLVSQTPQSETESNHRPVNSVDTPITYIIKTLLKSNFFSPSVCEYWLQTLPNPWTRVVYHELRLSGVTLYYPNNTHNYINCRLLKTH